MNYQGEQVNFSQDMISNNQLLSALQATNRQVATNSDNLVKIGTDTTYFGTKVTEIDGRLATNESNLIKMGNDMTQMGIDTTNLGNGIKRIDNAIKGILQSLGTTNNAVQRNSENLVQIGIDHENMGTGGGGNPFGLSTLALGAAGLGAYLLLRKK